ncbi:UDP-4-amino-4,6-dideoxy-N-acetyl-beta-L-altrosamine N-acetyltransferase [Brevibacillus sp. SYP-B805]|uniref:UDP-4-amino-4, 6-dideoxy-N-acetyl-beta-L-altrosamine N-acetyltransferase n=1 Tax=Brevibacillus sp. SYP-B805 TaxID=1578199 RepID=UPI0013ED4B1D|nr:UDP-4-amino-4,6-dideoxy-N-acetyl-beta-L-altrosamine N-acetyltransferase [Brevibacillus sp. SYP-B805]NGQ95649.1 UDP-4-amino-4,6-dideoxy-N-acetyl-beta-L-altrosamine N-acetyltransferase [Brevibacillus sp. SYP-B805]
MITFTRMKEEHLEQVLKWRTQEDVTRFMYTDVEYDLDQQRKWFERISNSPTEKYWIISIQGKNVGVISLNQIDYRHKRSSTGFYIGEEKYRVYGGIIPPFLYNYAFRDLGLKKITAEVMEGNENVVKLHKIHGYREVGTYRNHIYKYGKYHDVYLLELLQEDWVKESNKYRKYQTTFD